VKFGGSFACGENLGVTKIGANRFIKTEYHQMKKQLKLTTLATAFSLATVGLAFADTTVNVTLMDMDGAKLDLSKKLDMGIGMKGDHSKATLHVMVDQPEIPAGKVTFKVANAAKELQHEMLVVPIKDDKTPMPFVDDENRADEDKAGSLGEVAELDPGKSGDLTLDLKPGLYALFCNIPGHYGAGMWTTVSVK
jgi:uncharacterized cupredoxin-like copper-binding protein